MSIGVFYDGLTVHRANYGYLDYEAQHAPNSDTIYWAGSLSKSMTFCWQRDEARVLIQKEDFIKGTTYLPTVHRFRSTWSPSNWNYVLADRVIEKVSGISYDIFPGFDNVAEAYVYSAPPENRFDIGRPQAQDLTLAAVESLVPEDVLRAKIEARNLTFYNAAHDAAIVQLRQIMADERSERVLNRLKEVGLEDGQYQTIDLAAITRAAHLSNEDQAVNDIHDILKAYYKVALKRYIDNVVLQVIERIYLGSNGLVRAISPEYVGTLSDTELADIAAESYATSSTRTEIGYKLQRLDKALNLAETLPI
ncbi:hypothetical protein VF21_07938 [Pseudogymnoascus sp. 05NY08]|nr:hypothetical protein VF21_07938 [Pseudogymnoascus sp. 05NY08]